MSQRKTTKNRKIEAAVRKMQATHAAFTEFVKLNEMLISAMDQDNLARVKSLCEKIGRCEEQIGQLVGPSSKAMEEALHDRWPTEFRAPAKPRPTTAPPAPVEDHEDQKSAESKQPVTSSDDPKDRKSVSEQPTADDGGSDTDQENDPAFK